MELKGAYKPRLNELSYIWGAYKPHLNGLSNLGEAYKAHTLMLYYVN